MIAAGGDGLAGKRVEFPGLEATITDVLVRVRLRDGRLTTTLVHPSRPWIEVASSPGLLAVAAGYLTSGIHHSPARRALGRPGRSRRTYEEVL